MAAELAGGAFLSSLFGKLFDKLDSLEYLNFFRGLKFDEELLRKLKIKLCSANQVLDDAELKQLTNPNVREWLFELKDAICVAEELLDDINYETLRYEIETKSGTRFKKLKPTISSYSTTFDRAIEKILDRLENILEQKDVFGIKQGVTNIGSIRLPAPLADESSVYGRDGDKEKIINLLLSDNGDSRNKISVIPIVGMGGIGKTTLAQLVYDDERVKGQFKIRSWVSVSDESDIFIIAKKILRQITSKKCGREDLHQLQCKLKEALSEKKFLIVLDDVWNENHDHWNVLLSSFRSGASGSKIIVTTRLDNVAKKMGNVPTHHLEVVSDDDGLKLFAEHVFNRNESLDAYEDLLVIAREIVKKCKGVPLAIKSLAGLLRSIMDPKEWKEILNSSIWELQLQGNGSNNILPSLWLSYQYLPLHLKRCFAYCSIFPKDYEINKSEKEHIIQLWMAEGLLQSGRSGKRLEEIGNEYFHDLISRSLFQPLSTNKSTILMHDLTHDLAEFVSGEFSCRLGDNDKATLSRKTRHISHSISAKFMEFDGLSAAKSLHSFIQLPLYRMVEPRMDTLQPELLPTVGECLRALVLRRPHFTVLPDLVGQSKHLRYLDLSRSEIVELPNTLCSLFNLQTLRLSYCGRLTQLPSDIGNLVKLRHLNIELVPLKKMPPNMSNIEDLQTLSNFVVGKNGGSSIKELGGFRYLSGKLEISELQNVDVIEDVWEAKLKYRWRYDGGANDDKDREVLDALQPHPNVKEIVIDGYGAQAFSNWVGHCSYTNMVTVHLINCYVCRLFPPLGQLPSLQYLRIRNCHDVERIGTEFYGDTGSSNIKPYFRSLKSLEFEDMSELKEWSFPDQDQEDGECFSSLEHLCIARCPKLQCVQGEMLPTSLTSLQLSLLPTLKGLGEDLQHLTCLERLGIEDCKELQSAREQMLPTSLTSLQMSSLPSLKVLGEGLQHLTCLEKLGIEDCKELQCIRVEMLPTSLTSLQLVFLPTIKDLGEDLQHLTCLERLRISNCKELQCVQGEMLPTSLTSLQLSLLPTLKDLGESLQHLTCLEKLGIEDCKELQSVRGEMLPASLTSLQLAFLPTIKDFGEGLQHLTCLERLRISDCKEFQCVRGEMLPISVTSLGIIDCPNVEDPGKGFFEHLNSLENLEIIHCNNLLSSLEENGLPTSLTYLCIGGFPNLRNLNHMGFQHLNSLKWLKIHNCEHLECLPEEGMPLSLSSLEIKGCPLLERRCQRGTDQDWHKISHIPHRYIGQEFTTNHKLVCHTT